MGNPFAVVGRFVANYARDLKNAPAAQYMTQSVAPSVIPSTTAIPPAAYRPAHGRPESASAWSVDEVSMEKERLKTMAALSGGVPPGPEKKKKKKKRKKFNAFDIVVTAAGSRWAFFVTMLLLVAWAVLGIVYGPTDTWQVILQDASSIQCYISATLLMRQQQSSTRSLLNTIGEMLSRSQSNERMLRQLLEKQLTKLKQSQRAMRRDVGRGLEARESGFDRAANAVATFLGSLVALGIYWAGILVWVFWGVPLGFSNTWQLYVNTATALELTFTTMFLQNVRQQHERYLERCLQSIERVDQELERELRCMTGDMEANPMVSSQPPRLGRMEKGIDVWAFVVGGSVGVCLSVAVFVVWLSIGRAMEFDDNWWLIIGTYTGLMGYVDGFVMRNVDQRETRMADEHFGLLAAQDARLFWVLDLALLEEGSWARGRGRGGGTKQSVSERVSGWIGHVCSVPGATVAAVASVGVLVVTASAMQWTETGQLLCNTPTMIVEGFLLLVLVQSHNQAEDKRRQQYMDILERRLMLERRVAGWADQGYELEVKLADESLDVAWIGAKYGG